MEGKYYKKIYLNFPENKRWVKEVIIEDTIYINIKYSDYEKTTESADSGKPFKLSNY